MAKSGIKSGSQKQEAYQPKPGTWEYAYMHRGPDTPAPPPGTSKIFNSPTDLPGGRRAWIEVQPQYAYRHPEAVLFVDGKYYRASVPTAAVQSAQAGGMTESEAFAEAKRIALSPFPEQVKRLGGMEAIGHLDWRTGEYLLPADIQSQIEREVRGLSALRGEALFNKQMELGFIPKGSIYISETQYIPPAEVKKIRSQSPELHKVLTTQGWDAYQAELKKYQRELKVFEQTLKTNYPDLYKIYREKGLDAYNAEVKRQQDALAALEKAGVFSTVTTPEAAAAISEATKVHGRATIPESVKSGEIPSTVTVLDMGKVVTANVSLEAINAAGFDMSQKTYDIFKDLEAEYKDEEGGYKLAKYLNDNPEVTSTALVTAGFGQKDVDAAFEYNKQPWVGETPGEKYFEAIRNLSEKDAEQLQLYILSGGQSGYGWLNEVLRKHPDIAALQAEAVKHPSQLAEQALSLDAFSQAFLATRDYNEATDDKHKSQRAELELLARMEYQRLYGAGAIGLTDNLTSMSRDLLELVASASPKGTSVPAQIGRGALTGAADLLIGICTLPIVGLETAGHLASGKPGRAGELVVNTGVGIKDYFVLLGTHVMAQPAEGIPRATVVLFPIIIPGVKTGIRVIKGATATAAPHGVPMRGMAIELDVSRIPFSKAGYEAALKAVTEALERQLRTDPRSKRLVGEVIVQTDIPKITTIKRTNVREVNGVLTGDVIDKSGGVVKLAHEYLHPVVGGTVRRRVTAVVVDKNGRLLLGIDRVEPKGYYNLLGGDMWQKRLAPGSTEAGIRYPIEAYALMQVASETGIGLRNMKVLPAYLGKMNRHSLSGSYVVHGLADTTKINIFKWMQDTKEAARRRSLTPEELREMQKGPELKDAIWWDGKTDIGVSPATYDIIVRLVKDGELKGIDTSRLHISEKTPVELLTARDFGYYKPESLTKGMRYIEYSLKYRRSPIQAEVPDTLYHATPDVAAMLAELKQKGYITVTHDLFTSPQAAMDFLRGGSSGVPPIKPAILAIRIADLKGFRMPFKSYRGAIEAEVVGSKGVRLYATEPNSFSRLFGNKITGETFTQYKGPSQTFKTTLSSTGQIVPLAKTVRIKSGQLVPVYWLKTARAKAGAPSIGSLYAATGLALFETIKDLPYLRPRRIKFSFYGSEGALMPFRSAREAYKLVVRATKELEAEATQNVRRIAKKGWTEADYARAYRLELKKLVDRETRGLLETPEVKEAIRRNRAAFEQAYTINLSRAYAIVALGSQGRLREARLERERPEVVTTYRYRNGRLTRVKEETTGRRTREERPELIPIRQREAPRGRRRRPALTTTRRRVVPPVERRRVVPPVERRRVVPPVERRRVPPTPPRTPPPTPPRTPPPILTSKAEVTKAKREDFRGAVTWKQGFGWWSVKAPYSSQADVAFFRGEPPPGAEIVKGGAKSAFRSIQTITGKPPEKLKVDLGIMDILISKPKKKPGAPGAISFKHDVEQKPGGDITITSTGKGEPRVTKEIAEESLTINPTKNSKMSKEVALAIGSYSAKVGSDGKPKIKVRRL